MQNAKASKPPLNKTMKKYSGKRITFRVKEKMRKAGEKKVKGGKYESLSEIARIGFEKEIAL